MPQAPHQPPTQPQPAAPSHAHPSTSSATQAAPRPSHQQQHPLVLPLQNIQNTCYACATIQALFFVDATSHVQMTNMPVQDNLTNLLRILLNSTPNSPRFDLVQLINALNLCLPAQNMFSIGQQECAGEFLDALLENVNVSSYISSFEEFAVCPVCSFPQVTGLPTTRSPYMLLLPIDETSAGPADVATMVTRLMNQSHGSTVCQTVGCPAQLSPLVGVVQCREQALKIFWIGRNLTGGGVKCLQQMVEPGANALWRGRICVAAVAHSGRSDRGGHWFTFLKESGVWWRTDTSFPAPRQENPFLTQLVPTNPPTYQDFTIDILIFR